MTREEVRALVDRLIDAWNSHDADAVAACYASEAVSRDAGRETALPGRDSIQRSIHDYLEAFPDFQAGVTRVGIDGELVYAEWHATGTHTGTFLGIPPTNQMIEVRGCNIARAGSDGLIISETTYWDVADLLAQMGSPGQTSAEASPT